MARLSKDHLDKFYDYDVWIEGRTLYIGAQRGLESSDEYGMDEISSLHSERVIKGLALLETKPEEPIKIILNSPGGDVYQGLAIYDAIKRSPCHITIIATGQCMSAASIILQAGDKRVLSKHCIVMIHDGYDSNSGTPAHVLKWAKFGLKINDMMYDIYTEGAGHNSGYWKRKCQEDYILTAEQALAEGLADEII